MQLTSAPSISDRLKLEWPNSNVTLFYFMLTGNLVIAQLGDDIHVVRHPGEKCHPGGVHINTRCT